MAVAQCLGLKADYLATVPLPSCPNSLPLLAPTMVQSENCRNLHIERLAWLLPHAASQQHSGQLPVGLRPQPLQQTADSSHEWVPWPAHFPQGTEVAAQGLQMHGLLEPNQLKPSIPPTTTLSCAWERIRSAALPPQLAAPRVAAAVSSPPSQLPSPEAVCWLLLGSSTPESSDCEASDTSDASPAQGALHPVTTHK